MSGGPDIYDDIIKELHSDAELDDDTFRRYVLLVLVDLGRSRKQIAEIKKKVDLLERNSLLLQCKRHPKITIPVLTFLAVFVFTVIVHLELWAWIFNLIGVPLP